MTIWKFPLRITDEQIIELPDVHQFLAVQVQNGVPCIWAAVDPDKPRVLRTIRIVGTGHHLTDFEKLGYVGTFQVNGGALVFQVFYLAQVNNSR